MNTTHLRQLLEKSGYTLAFREDDWVKCLVSGHSEQWLGKGFDENGALQDVARQMFPSRVALDLLDVGLVALAQPAVEVPIPDTPDLSAPTGNEPEKAPPAPEPEAEKEPAVVAPAPVAVDPIPEPEPTPEPVAVDPTPELVDATTQKPVTPQEVISFVAGDEPVENFDLQTKEASYAGDKTYVAPSIETEEEEEEEKLSKEEGLEIVRGILDELEDNIEDVALMSTTHQKLQIADWIFRGRTIQEQFLRDREVEEAVHKIAQRLTDVCKTFWPGSVQALQVYSTPLQALDGLVRTNKAPFKWAEAAEIIEQQIQTTEGRRDYDDFGWRDISQLKPDAPDPHAILCEAVTKIESVIGELGGPLDNKRKVIGSDKIVNEIEELVMAAHLLRWVRRSVADKMKWGRAMGALRWASRQSRTGTNALREILGEDYRPSKPWAEMLGRNPEVNRKNRLRKEVMTEMPAAGWLEEDLMGWLHNAFQVLTNPQIAKMAGAVQSEILEFTNADFADKDRLTRSRLRKLQGILRNGQDLSRVDLPSEGELDDGVPEPEESTTKSNKNVDPTELILVEVQKMVAGKHILFVTNRADVRLQESLEENLKCKVTLKDGGNPRTMKSVRKSVSGARYDYVLMATGFNNHSADAALCRVTKAQGIPYVRVQKGRLAATIRALGRAFNLSPQCKAPDEATVAHVG